MIVSTRIVSFCFVERTDRTGWTAPLEDAASYALNHGSNAESPTLPLEDRRQHPRFLLSLAITMLGDNNFYSGLSENISEAGVFIASRTSCVSGGGTNTA